jgi:cholesterol transport system auxiliary component
LSVLVACALSGCSGLGGLITKSPPPAFDLAAARDFPHHGRTLRGQLIIAEPTALSALDGDRIVVRPSPGEAAALGGAQWQDRLPKLIQARLLQSFENANLLRRVGTPGEGLAADYVLVSTLRAFEISAADQSAAVEIAVKIVAQRSGRIAAARVFRAVVPAPSMEGPAAVAALNDAFVKVAKEIVLWAARAV